MTNEYYRCLSILKFVWNLFFFDFWSFILSADHHQLAMLYSFESNQLIVEP